MNSSEREREQIDVNQRGETSAEACRSSNMDINVIERAAFPSQGHDLRRSPVASLPTNREKQTEQGKLLKRSGIPSLSDDSLWNDETKNQNEREIDEHDSLFSKHPTVT